MAFLELSLRIWLLTAGMAAATVVVAGFVNSGIKPFMVLLTAAGCFYRQLPGFLWYYWFLNYFYTGEKGMATKSSMAF